MNQHPSRLVAAAAAAALGLALLTGCPAEEKKDTGTTTTTTTTTASAAPDAGTMAASAAPAGTTSTTTSTTSTTTTTAAAGDVEAGKTLFAARCQACHGAAGVGGMGPALAAVDKKGDAYIHEVVLKGRPAKGMPAFEGQLKAAEIDSIVAYVKSI